MRVLLIGSNPSNASATSEAFKKDTVSGRILQSWLDGINATFLVDNVVTAKTQNNRALSKAEIVAAAPQLLERINAVQADRIVALGKTASKALTHLRLPYLEMPHPSGLNRLLNDPMFVERKLLELRMWCSE